MLPKGGARAMTDRRYFLNPEVFLCISDNNLVFRDIRTDDFFALPMAIAAEFGTALVGWPSDIDCQREDEQALTDETCGALEEMVSQGLLTTNPAVGKEATPFVSPVPTSSLRGEDLRPSALTQLRYIPGFLRAAHAAANKLRTRIPDPDIGPWKITSKVMDSVRIRRIRNQVAWDAGKAKLLASVACELRPWFNEKSVCTLDSLIYIEFFARHRLFPDWIFGVQANPPDAHCWVQHRDVLINDTIDVVTQFTPIMAA